MVIHSDTPATIVSLPSLVPAPPEILERAYELWSTVGGRNAAATRRLMEAEAEDGDPVPTDRAIRKWARESAWAVRADRELPETKDATLYELGVKWRALILGSADVLLAAQTGGYAGREMEGALAVKASEIAMRQVERGVVPLVVEPPVKPVDTSALPREEKEAHARSLLVRRKGKGA
jgi:hypothetical protein